MSSSSKLGRLERVDLRTAWASEAQGFTPWLGQEENLNLLGEAIGLELELESQERNVGPFRADLLCKNTEDDSWVLIENQLARTDHTHLGQPRGRGGQEALLAKGCQFSGRKTVVESLRMAKERA